jgi:hypothetical protein
MKRSSDPSHLLGRVACSRRYSAVSMVPAIAVVLAAGLLFLAGCAPKEPPKPRGYFGPTDTLPQLVSRINANNQRIPTLWCRVTYDVNLHDPETSKTTSLYDEKAGTLQYRAPAEFRLRANKTGVGLVMDMGINDERYWLVAPAPGPDAMWWGNVDQPQPAGHSDIPIRPEDILQVLAVATFNTDLTAEPAPVLRFNNDADAYMVVSVAREPDRYVAVREVWYDRQTLLPTIVLLFDPNGRIVLRAYLKAHQEIPTETKPGPRIATQFDIWLPDTGSKMILSLSDLSLTHKEAPNDLSFRFPGFGLVPESKVKQVDAQVQK